MDKAEVMLITDEGLELMPYIDTTGNLTLGAGRNVSVKGISREEALFMLRNDIADAEKSARKIFGQAFDYFPSNRRLGLINLIFNLGEAGFLKFTNTLALMKAGRWEEAADRLRLSLWYKQVKQGRGERVISLLKNLSFPYKE